MEGESSFSVIAPSVFDGDSYQMWAVRMETYLEALDLWEAIEEDYEVPPLPANPTVAQIKVQKEKKIRKSKAKACLFSWTPSSSYGAHSHSSSYYARPHSSSLGEVALCFWT